MQPSVLILIRGHVSLKPSIMLARLLHDLGSKGEKSFSPLFGESQNRKNSHAGHKPPRQSWAGKRATSLGISVKDGGETALSPRGLVGLQLLAPKGVCAYFNLCQRDEKAKRKPAKCQGGTRKGAGEMQRKARERGGTRGVQEWLQAGSGLGSRLLQPTWSCGVRGNGTLRTFPINTQNCIKEIPGCHHQRILPVKTILARP